MNERPQCGDCLYWQAPRNPQGYIEAGTCRRYPPQTSSRNGHVFPYTAEADWCGEFVAKAKAKEIR